MAGNDSDARRRAEQDLKTAKTGGKKTDIAAAQAHLNTATRTERTAMGKKD
jgi:hypothetical protein